MIMKHWGRKLFGLLLSLVMTAGLLPGILNAAMAEGKTITGLGTGAITNPSTDGTGGWCYVYYGKYNDNPLKYRVLSKNTSDFGGTTMLLDCDSILLSKWGADFIVDGGQSMNPSAQDFLKAFEQINADTIFVLPNNGNVILAAQQAAKMYKDSQVHVIETKNIGQGLAVVTMMDTENCSTDEIIENLNLSMQGVETFSVSHCVRDTQMDGFELHSGDYIGFCDKSIVASDNERKKTVIDTIDKMDFSDHEVCIFIRGTDSDEKEASEISDYIKQKHNGTEIFEIDGGQDIYSYIMVLE